MLGIDGGTASLAELSVRLVRPFKLFKYGNVYEDSLPFSFYCPSSSVWLPDMRYHAIKDLKPNRKLNGTDSE